ncbi:lysosome-associated membrane glycoprotein 1 [Clarias gariepinus]|uniref:macrosialin n=1 Tax=Clarias gariepinus TaxID=13013 RepID=UPI00234DAEFB|nr:macrosialin [Clarias gariepinus]
MRLRSARFIVAVLALATALTFAEKDARPSKPIASMLPPAPFPLPTTTPKTTTPHTNITTLPPTTPTTTTNVTTPSSTTANATTHNITTPSPTTHNITTPSPTTHNITTPSPTTHNITTPSPTTHNITSSTPNVTTAGPHPTTPGPTPPTNITVGNYTLKDGKKLCVMVQAAIQIRVNNSQMEGTYIVPGGEHPNDGKCDDNTASLKISVKEGSISLTFFKNDTSNVVFVKAVAVNLTYAFKPGVSHSLLKKNESVQLFSMAISHSYSCKSESVFLGDGAFLEFHQERMQAFNFTNNQFGTLDLCKADQPDYRVAIGVGVVLLILIIIVVVAYLISRRRRTDGYQAL